MIGERLAAWFRRNGNLPERIMIYRDGVGEPQFEEVVEEELSQIEAACEIRYDTKTTGDYPKISMFVCGKGHHTRFYPTQNQDGDDTRGQNCRNGTVVDRGVTSEHWWDFFLQAHHAFQGTAQPTRYIVVRDDNQLDANTLESFRIRMYLYNVYNASQFDDATAPVDAEGNFDENRVDWFGGLHQNIKDSMFYI
ncbi:MAG: hypothetical protein Q9204_007714 [Flavoplaca sp. TL-2023a]